ncbi:MAG: cupin domain-containing protein [Actinomycetota bacterium]|jgi:quercetin dioxygenase-like cupin family protein|nr:cupin domain-containing protein [Actinomycetota bacterium]
MIIKRRSEFKPEIMNDNQIRGVKFYPLITAQDGAPNFAMRVFEVEPGGYSPRHSHKWEHEIYVIEGSGYAVKENGVIPIGKDDCILVEPSELHQIKAGEEGITFICVVPHEGQPS